MPASPQARVGASRRVVALVLPELLCELVQETVRVAPASAFGVVLVEQPGADSASSLPPTAILDAVSAEARRLGVGPGQSIAEACALVADLAVHELPRVRVLRALGRVAEAALYFGPTVAIEPPGVAELSTPALDTVWVEITGAEHLVGGEAALLAELASLVQQMGHVVRGAAASGPRLAQALARWSPAARAPAGSMPIDTPQEIAALPVVALPIGSERASWLVRLGLLTWKELAQLPRAAAAARLGVNASEVLDLCAGNDPAPLVAYQPPQKICEALSFEDSVVGGQPLLFALRGLAFRVSVRLAGRGQAAQSLLLVIQHDHAVARLRGAATATQLKVELPSPLWQPEQLCRVLGAQLERTQLCAPTIGLHLEVPAVTRAATRQLDLHRAASGLATLQAESLPVLLAELAVEIGQERVGVLQLVDLHRPEARSRLVACGPHPGASAKQQRRSRARLHFASEPTRFFPQPLPLDTALRIGATCMINQQLYSIERLAFERRLEAVQWWSPAAVSRDYLRVWFNGAAGSFEGLVFVDLRSGARFLQAIAD